MTYYQSKILKSVDIAGLRGKVEAGLKEIGFGILMEIDLQATMKKKMEKDYPPFRDFNLC